MPIATELTRTLGIKPNPEALREAIKETRKRIGSNKGRFGVNITLLPSINPPDYAGYAKAALDEGVDIFETAGNNPKPLIEFIKSYKAAGASEAPPKRYIIHKCVTVKHALSGQKMGVDVLSIDGFECAGHPGEDDIGGLVLGVNMGTRFMCTVESPIHQKIKEKIVESTEKDTIHIFRAGIAVGLINDIPTCADLVQQIDKDASEVIMRMKGMVVEGERAKL
ncbi:hypothetical protein CI109_103584 [Kwoniella shandongensis]|uniref:Nitronate monooxygenase domain-containing protein n=1 Tax=Kwoniella shandongensis TaxID=1734106 RepID=A0AAJ8LIF5_9TREE